MSVDKRPGSRPPLDRLLDVAINGRDGLDDALVEIVNGREDQAPETMNWLRDVLDSARRALANGDSEHSIGDLASAAQSLLRGDILELAALLCGLAANYSSQLEGAGQDVEPIDAAHLRNTTGLLAFHVGRLDVAEGLFMDARNLAAHANDPGMGARALLNLCNVARLRNDYATARSFAVEAERLYGDAGDLHGQYQLGLTLTTMAIDDDNFDEAAERLATLSNITKLRQADLTGSYHYARARVLAHERRWEDAERAMQASLRAARRAHHSDHEVATMQSLAALAAESGRTDLARTRTRAAVDLARKRHFVHRLTNLLPSYISGELKAGNIEGALAAGHEYLALAAESGYDAVNAHFLVGSAELENGNAVAALERLETARELLAALPGDISRDLEADIFHNTVLAVERLGAVGEQAEPLARWARDLAGSARALEHLGFALAREQRWEDATRVLLEAFALHPVSERAWAGLVASHQLEGRNNPGPRTALLRSAVGVAEEQGQHTVAIRIRNDLALARIDAGDLDEALTLLIVNLNAAIDAGDRVMQQQALYNVAETRRRLDDLEGARRDAYGALDLAETLEDVEHVASSLVQVAQILGEQDQHQQAEPLYERARETAPAGSAVYAAALSGLAGLALADDPAAAARLYTESLELRDFGTVNYLENLVLLNQALAATGERRTYLRRLQQIVDESLNTPLNLTMAMGMAHAAAAWSAAGKPKYAGETLAITLLIWAREIREENGGLDDEDSAFYTGLSAVAYELHREADEGEPAEETRAAIEKELLGHDLADDVVAALLRLLKMAERPFQGADPEEEDGP